MVADMQFPYSKHLHMTVPVAFPQNVHSCTHILPITEDRCSKLPMCYPYYYLVVVCFCHAFSSPVCASYVARICVTFNYPPTHRPGITHAIVQ